MYVDFVRNRISQLRISKGVSEYKMSYALGHSRGYIYNISSGKALPPMSEFFAICNYFGITPREFFDEENSNPQLVKKAAEEMIYVSSFSLLKDLKRKNKQIKHKMRRINFGVFIFL